MKKLLLAALIATPAMAAQYGDWHCDESVCYAYDINGSSSMATIYVSQTGYINIGVMGATSACNNGFSKYGDPSISVSIEGTRVKMMAQCLDGGYKLVYPQTWKGTNYMIDLFKHQKAVCTGGACFSAMGFTNAYTSLKVKTQGI